ncbi:hypothetical protein AXG93_1913s1110 [Marchantia polymorpha subsp. ruderalis]|uniref:Beta-galactosidase n=1 Tax=Marchantia polymorpha subsp. ruderalis TaxID=1480154 RepID=A0A176WIG7_MARPO|nr:hypothetical protein AXG93_1913s1110 [Marchantia polymorpha subsp. ruderalis]
MWPGLIDLAKKGGIDLIQTYVFWDGHEPEKGKYDFTGRYDIVQFVKLVADSGLYVNLRIGPYVCAEWSSGGFPLWLRDIPGIEFRTDNEPFKVEMEGFTRKIVSLMKENNLFASQGGPIILAQVENEYGNIDSAYGASAMAYITWAAKMAEGLDTGVPWIMCQQDDAPANIINTCNGFYCDWFSPNDYSKPKMWTENWAGWFHNWGKKAPHRPAEDVAYAVALFFAKGGSFQNYYMYHGGTNFERTAGERIATSYDYDAPLDEYGQVREPKYSHLKELHAAIKACEPALAAVDGDAFTMSLGSTSEVHVYGNGNGNSLGQFVSSSEVCAAFLVNWGDNASETVQFNEGSYDLPACVDASDSSTSASIHLDGVKDTVHIFVDGVYAGSPDEFDLETVEQKINLKKGQNSISVLSMTLGLQNYGAYLEKEVAGISEAKLVGLSTGDVELTNQEWEYQIGLKGEELKLYTEAGMTKVTWESAASLPVNQPLHWYKVRADLKGVMQFAYGFQLTWKLTTIDAPSGNGPVALDLGTMGKGQAWINGVSIGRYWTLKQTPFLDTVGGCSDVCDYRGTYKYNKCTTGCGDIARWYHVPREWLKATGNLLVIFEETGGDPTGVSLGTQIMNKICAYVSESHPVFVSGNVNTINSHPLVQLDCSPGHIISEIRFASFGTPSGTCGRFQEGICHSSQSTELLVKECVGKQQCSVNVTWKSFEAEDPCPGLTKSLAVEAACEVIGPTLQEGAATKVQDYRTVDNDNRKLEAFKQRAVLPDPMMNTSKT